jgi:hypothetical protein
MMEAGMEFKELRAELQRNGETIQKLLDGVTPVQARRKPAPDAWSMLEVICHLYDEEREDFRQRLKIMLDGSGQEWPAINPAGWVTERNYIGQDFDAMLAKWVAERTNSLAWLDGLSGADWSAVTTTKFGSMRAGDMLAAWVRHDILHMRQLVELKHARVLELNAPYDGGYAGDW